MIRFIHVSEKISVLKSFFLISLFSFLSYSSLNAQFYITVPFTNGFVGDNTANNQCTNAYYTAGSVGVGLGWTNIQFAQNSTASIFTLQGNDIVGSVLITDASGVEKTINGFVKWRAPSGTVTTMCFQPTTGTNITLATNGTNGSSSYTITDTKYIGLTFNGQTLSITGVPGTVSGNAATSGLLDILNNYLATFPKLTVGDVTVSEGTASVNVPVTLSASPSSNVTVYFSLSDSTALITSDYLAATSPAIGYITFLANTTTLSQNITIPIVNNAINEPTEYFKVILSDPTNASITDGLGIVTITDNDLAPTADAGPATASICSSSTYTTTGTATNGTIAWTTSGTGTFADATLGATLYTPSAADVSSGTVTLTMSVTGSGLTVTDNVVLTINTAPSSVSAAVTTQPSCSTATGTITVASPTGANMQYSLNNGTYQSSTIFGNLSPNNYSLTVRNSTTSCVSTPISLTVNTAPSAPSTPAGSVTTQPTCGSTTGTIVFTAQSGVDYSIDGTTYQSSATFTGVAAGTYTLKVRSTTDNTCTATGSTVTVNAAPSAPSTPAGSVTIQPTCGTTTGTIVFTTQSGVEYSINGTTYQSSATFTGVAAGTYTLIVRSTTDNTCTATGSTVTVNAVPSAPSTPTGSVTVQPSCGVNGTIVFTTQLGVEYSINGTIYQSSATFTGVVAGTYTLKVRSTTDNTCTATGSSVTVNAAPGAPSTPAGSVTVQPTCGTTTGTIVFTTQSGVEYSINGTTYQSSATFTGVAAGTYTLKVRSTTDNTCTATGSSVTVNAAPGAPSTPAGSVTVQPTCGTTTGTIVFTTQSGVEYSIDGTTYQSSATFTGVAAGTYTLKVRSTTDNTCTATGSTVTVNAVPSAPSTPAGSVTVQPTCGTTTGTIVFTTQSGVEYSINGTTYQASTTFTGVAAGTYTLKVRSTTDNTCTATGSTVTVNAAPSAPSTPAGSVTIQPTCGTTTGTIVFTTQSGVEYSINGTTYQASTTFTGVAAGTYTLKVRSTTDNTCTATGSTVTVNAAPSAPSTPAGSVTIQPTCGTTTGTIVFTTQSGVEYSIDGTTYQSSATFTGVAAGTYTLKVRSTTDNTCTATGSTVTVNAAPSAPSTPAGSVTVQPTCGTTTGTIVFTTQSGVEYSIDGTTYQSSATFAGVAAGTYTLKVRSTTDNTCTATGSTVTVNAAPSAPSTPAGSVTVQPTCGTTTGTIVFTTQSGVEYSINGTTYQTSATFTGVASGTYTLKVRSTTDNTCTATGSTLTVNAVPSAPSTPAGSVTVQPTCGTTTGTIVFTTQSGVEYSINGTTYQSSATFTGVAAGTYTLKVRSTTDNTCAATGSTVTVNAAPSAPSTPVGSVTVQPTCGTTTGIIVFTTQSGVEYSINGTTYQSSATFNAIPGTYSLKVRSTLDNTCISTGNSVTINPIPNCAPVANNDAVTTNEDTPVTVSVTTNDTDVDGTINVATVDLDPTTAGIQTSKTTANGTFTVNASGVVTFTPNLNFNGTATVTYTVNDNGGLTSNTATITITVIAVNDAPVANNDAATTNEDIPVTVTVPTNDTDVDGTINIATVDLDPTTAGIQTSKTTANGTFTVNASGVVTFTPNLNFNGTATVTYTVNDNGGLTSNTATITITVTAVNDAPVANNDAATTNEDTPVTVTVPTNDTDVDGTINIATVDLDPTTAGIQTSKTTVNGTFTVNASGVVTFTPNLNFNGTATVTYTVNDNGGLTSNTATITITVTAVNDAPVANNDAATTNEDTPVTVTVPTNDTDVDGTINIATVDLDPTTAGIQTSKTTVNGTFTVNASGVVTFTPNLNFNGTATVTYTVNDNGGLTSNTATITITITAVNDAPVANNDAATTNEDTPVTVTVPTNDTDVDGTINIATVDLDPTTAGIQTSKTTANGTFTVNASGVVTFTPNLNFNGTATVTYTVNDNGGLTSNTATITITVTAVNDAPVIDNDTVTISYNGSGSGDLTDNGDSDVDGNLAVNTTPISGPNHGTITINSDGTFVYTPDLNYVGEDTVIVSICDDGTPLPAICVNDTLFVTVNACSITDVNQDCDNDGLTNQQETTLGSDPFNPDTDGDGVIDGTEVADGTNPLNPCLFDVTHQTVAPSTSWLALDCDNDGLTNSQEITLGIDPLNPDSDGDGVIDGTEVANNTNPIDPCAFVFANQTVVPSNAWNNLDCDNDGILNQEEVLVGIDPNNPDTDGDGVTDDKEVADGTNPNDPCDYIVTSQTVAPSTAWNALDCDNDGLTNGEELDGDSNPLNPCSPNQNAASCVTTFNPNNAFTPDGDGINDAFVIQGLENFPLNNIKIFNRWGALVYEKENYDNSWIGNSISDMNFVSDELPTGTYYYVLDTYSKYGVLKGSIYLKR